MEKEDSHLLVREMMLFCSSNQKMFVFISNINIITGTSYYFMLCYKNTYCLITFFTHACKVCSFWAISLVHVFKAEISLGKRRNTFKYFREFFRLKILSIHLSRLCAVAQQNNNKEFYNSHKLIRLFFKKHFLLTTSTLLVGFP